MCTASIIAALLRWLAGCVTALAACAAAASAGRAQSPQPPRLETNEAYVAEVTRTSALSITDPMAVFAFVLDSLPERVTVYPTENHYYFSFVHDGARFAGNIKIDARLRDEGRVRFSSYREEAAGRGETLDVEMVTEPSRGVTVEKGRTPGVPGVVSRKERRVRAQRPVARQAARWGGGAARTIHRAGVR
jgi:hypothetical protein